MPLDHVTIHGTRRLVQKAAAALALAALVPAPSHGARPRHATLPAVSPDGHRIAFVTEHEGDAPQIGVIQADGRSMTRLTSSADRKGMPAWDRDGTHVTYLVNRGDSISLYEAPLSPGPARIVAAIEGKALVLSHDARRLAYTTGTWTRNRAWVGGADGRNAYPITDSTAAYYNIAWSPDDKQLAATHRDSTGALQVWLIDPGGGGARALTHFPASEGQPQWPAWSPDGRHIAVQSGVYSREKPETNTAHIWVIDVASGAATRLAPHDKPWLDETPSWFPDGKRLAYQSDRTGAMEIWVMKADGTDQRQLTKEPRP